MLIIVQARMGSSRLPGKMMLPFAQGKPLFEFVLDRVKEAGHPVVVAISEAPSDDELAELAQRKGTPVHRGEEEDVLARFITAAQEKDEENILRVCGDNPFIQPGSLQELANALKDSPEADYIGYRTREGVPTIRTHWGFWGEAVRRNALERAANATDDPFYREHVTNYLYFHPEAFKCEWLAIPRAIDEAKDVRLTVDTETDLNICRRVAERYPQLLDDPEGLVRTIQEHPEWIEGMRTAIKEQSK